MEFSVRTKRELKILLVFAIGAVLHLLSAYFGDRNYARVYIWEAIACAQGIRAIFSMYEHRARQRELQERREDEPTIAFVEITNKR
jgi:uncharacterized membrane protein